MHLTNSREVTAFFVVRAIVVAAMFVITPTILAPFYVQLVRSSGAGLLTVVTMSVGILAWVVTLLLFLALRGGFGGVPARVAAPERRGAVISSGAEIGAFLLTLVIVTVAFYALNAFVIVRIYASLRQSGQTMLIVPVSLVVSAVIAIVFFLLFILLRGGMTAGVSAEEGIGAYDEGGGAPMGFGQAVATCLRKYAVFSGRASRSEYWFWVLFRILVLIGLAIVDAVAFSAVYVLSAIAALALFLPSLAVSIRRLHDIDRSGWWFFISFVPLVGQIVMLIFLCTPGTRGENRFGMGPAGSAIPEVFA
jgi:uncharacterized membrane protein YhaH (DUF805 family)